MPDYIVRVIYKTGFHAEDAASAIGAVHSIAPIDVEFGPRGDILPFQIEDITAEEWDEENAERV